MKTRFDFHPVNTALVSALAMAFPMVGQAANGAAHVDFVIGDVKALTADGNVRPITKGGAIASGETIDTGHGRAQVRFSDGAQVALSPQTRFRIDDYHFNGRNDGSEKGFFSLLQGAMRTITGLVGRTHRDHYKVTTSVATIGIRGTEYSVNQGAGGTNITTGEGTVEVCNSAGCLILNSGETAFVADGSTQPQMTEQKTEIPPPPTEEGQLPGFESGNDVDAEGQPLALGAESPQSPGSIPLVSGGGYSFAGIGSYDTGEGLDSKSNVWMGAGADSNPPPEESTQATFSGSNLVDYTFTNSSSAFSATYHLPVSAEAYADGILAWGRWASADYQEEWEGAPDPAKTVQNFHYVVGMPTTNAEMSGLSGTDVGYDLTGSTTPTAWMSGGSTTANGSVSGSLTANFSLGTVSGDLAVTMWSTLYSTVFNNLNIINSRFSDSGLAVSSSDCGVCSCYANINGFFAGANAARAGLVYEITGTSFGTINGAAVFTQNSPPVGGGGGEFVVLEN